MILPPLVFPVRTIVNYGHEKFYNNGPSLTPPRLRARRRRSNRRSCCNDSKNSSSFYSRSFCRRSSNSSCWSGCSRTRSSGSRTSSCRWQLSSSCRRRWWWAKTSSWRSRTMTTSLNGVWTSSRTPMSEQLPFAAVVVAVMSTVVAAVNISCCYNSQVFPVVTTARSSC